MKIKNSEGQTLLTLMRVCLAFIACLCVGGAHACADDFFAFVGDFESVANDFVSDDSEALGRLPGRPDALYYTERENGRISYIFHQYYLVGESPMLGLVESSGREMLPRAYEHIILLPHSYALCQNGVWGFYDSETLTELAEDRWDGVEVLYDEDGCIDSDLIVVTRDGLKGATDFLGNVLIEPNYEEFHLYAQEVGWPLILVKRDGAYGFLNNSGDVVIRLIYDYASMDTFVEYADENDAEGTTIPIIYVLRNGDWGAIYRDKKGDPTNVDWSIDPTAEVASAYARQL